MKFGVYFYPWYNKQRWKEAPRRHTPIIGEYDSADAGVIKWQMEFIQWTGFDYIIFELLPFMDWCFENVVRAIEGAISQMKNMDLQWSFLIDTSNLPERDDEFHHMKKMVAFLESKGWTSNLPKAVNGKKLLFSFAPFPGNAEKLRRRCKGYEFKFPIWLPHWEKPDSEFDHPVHRPYSREAKERGVSVFDFLVPKGYISFWENSNGRSNYDGFSPVIPGYDDTLLKRVPQMAPIISHRKGDTLTRQFESAVQGNPDHVLFYSWNEYFETTNIEPAKEYGTLYVDLTRKLIKETRGWKRQG